MSQTKKVRSKEPKGYRRKKLLGLVPHTYDKNSRGYQAGAWKHWNESEQVNLRRSLGRAA